LRSAAPARPSAEVADLVAQVVGLRLEDGVRAKRPARNGDWEMLAAERPVGLFSRQLVLGDSLDLDKVDAAYDARVLRLTVPVAEKAKPRKIEVSSRTNEPTAISS
jgi:HSP20 family protein